MVTIRNTGDREGSEVAQLYLGFPKEAGAPPSQLRGFEKTASLSPGEETRVVFKLSTKDMSVWDIAVHDWRVVSGQFTVQVGSASDDIRAVGSFEI